MSRSRQTLLVAFAAVCVGLTVWVSAHAYPFHPPPVPAAYRACTLALLLGYFGIGLLLALKRPNNLTGLLVMLVGLTYLDVRFEFAWDLLPRELRTLVHSLSIFGAPFLVWLILGFPNGRLTGRAERVVLLLAFVWAIGGGIPWALIEYSPGLGDILVPLTNWANAFFALMVGVLVVLRLRRASPPERLALTPAWIAATVFTLLVIVAVVDLVGTLTLRQLKFLAYATDYASLLIPVAYGVGLLRLRSLRGAVGRLVLDLREQPAPGTLRDALARTLGDPSVELAFWLPDRQCFVDLDGGLVELPTSGSNRAVAMLERGSERLGALVFDPTLAQAPELVASVGAATSLALENERLHAAVRAQLEDVRASRQRIVEAADAERRRVERNIHDGAQQRLMALSIALKRAQRQMGRDVTAATAILDDASDELTLAVAELRELARGIHPSILTDDGLGPALEALADRSPVPCRVSANGVGRLPSAIESTAYFVASEALANVVKHAGADAVKISVQSNHAGIRLTVGDDGCGGADPARGSGLAGLSDRVAAVGGRLEVTSPPGGGTTVMAELPST